MTASPVQPTKPKEDLVDTADGTPSPFGPLKPEDLKVTARDWDYLASAIHNIRMEAGAGYDFIGSMLQGIKVDFGWRTPSGQPLSTACISYVSNKKQFLMTLNPAFFRICTLPWRMGILLHEMGHMTANHLSRIPALEDRDKANKAADACINQVTPFIPDKKPLRGIFPEDFGLPRNLTMEDYYSRWPDPPQAQGQGQPQQGAPSQGQPQPGQAQGQGGQGQGPGNQPQQGQGNQGQVLDTHDWDANADESDILDATEELVRRTMIKTNTSYSNLPGSIQDLLEEIDTRRKAINWKRQMKMFLKRHATGIDKEYTRTRPNKRYEYQAPGLKLGDMPKVLILSDSSGSMSVIELNAGFDQVDQILKVGMRYVTLGMWHTSLYLIEKYKKGKRASIYKKVQSGGTDFESCARYINKHKPDAVVVFTDGYFGDTQTKVNCPILFVISSGGSEKLPTTYPLQKMIKLPHMGE